METFMELKWKPPFFLRLFKLFVTIPQNSRKSRERRCSLLRSEDIFFLNINKPGNFILLQCCELFYTKIMSVTALIQEAHKHTLRKPILKTKKKIIKKHQSPLIFPEFLPFFCFYLFRQEGSAFIQCALRRGPQQHDKTSLLRRFPNFYNEWPHSSLTGSFCGFITQTYLYPNSPSKIKLSKIIFRCLLRQ